MSNSFRLLTDRLHFGIFPKSEPIVVHIYIFDKRLEDLIARTNKWKNAPMVEDISTRLGIPNESEHRSNLDIDAGGKDPVSEKLASEWKELMKENYFYEPDTITSILQYFGVEIYDYYNTIKMPRGLLTTTAIGQILEYLYDERDVEERLNMYKVRDWWNRNVESKIEGARTWHWYFNHFYEKFHEFVLFCERTIDRGGQWKIRHKSEGDKPSEWMHMVWEHDFVQGVRSYYGA